MLKFDPDLRITAYDALEHPYFKSLRGRDTGESRERQKERGEMGTKIVKEKLA